MAFAIVDYGMGNLTSVSNAVKSLGQHCDIIRDADQLVEYDGVILPGVGAFGQGIKNLRSNGWVSALNEFVIERGRLFLGLCLGMQLLATSGTEHGVHEGLNWIPGVVEKLSTKNATVRLPHIGWNDVSLQKDSKLYRELGESQTFYFVHSYAFYPEDKGVITGFAAHGQEFVASVEQGNIFATQFHPEKSQKAGLAVLSNFLEKAA